MLLLYRWLTRCVRRLAPAIVKPEGKIGRGLSGRARAHAELAGWGRERSNASGPLFWFHAPSVGEGLQARAVIEALRSNLPEAHFVFTHFSPSAERLAGRLGADFSAYLPWDLPETVGPALAALRPAALVFTKTEVWPVIVTEARARSIPVALVAGTVPARSGRARWPARALMRSTWRRLSLACAISEDDARGLERLGVPASAVAVTGDPGIDSAAARAEAADPDAPYLAPFRASPVTTLVAGSTWPADEAALLPALRALHDTGRLQRVVVAPHEPTGPHVARLMEALRNDGWSPVLLSAVTEQRSLGAHDAFVVDSVGILAHLYTIGDVAYVGGGFHDHGLHSVLEPAAAGLPVVFGPRHHNARAAADLVAAGGAKIAPGTGVLQRVLGEWLEDSERRGTAGARARDYIGDHRGAAGKTAELLTSLVG